MSKNISHDITAALGLRLPFHADASITFNEAAPQEHLYKPVKLTDNGTVALCDAGDTPIGSILVVERNDGVSVKVTVELGPIVRFNVDDATVFAYDGTGVAAAADGMVEAGDFGVLLSTRKGVAFVLTYGGSVAAAEPTP